MSAKRYSSSSTNSANAHAKPRLIAEEAFLQFKPGRAWAFLSATTCNVMPEKTPRKIPPEDYEIYNDPVGVMHFLPPKRCKNCDD